LGGKKKGGEEEGKRTISSFRCLYILGRRKEKGGGGRGKGKKRELFSATAWRSDQWHRRRRRSQTKEVGERRGGLGRLSTSPLFFCAACRRVHSGRRGERERKKKKRGEPTNSTSQFSPRCVEHSRFHSRARRIHKKKKKEGGERKKGAW